ncbi:hypothetical protein FGO68_gene2099 [Halteria grandinella]|uniref:Uncharacterized protein n=1 Tax=Halteria grandinella TaxID=5974 RepID=A0A8J8STN6_HALGN|nr:hypothetical protein FGO68_gene2099 [Halteria grandinella]
MVCRFRHIELVGGQGQLRVRRDAASQLYLRNVADSLLNYGTSMRQRVCLARILIAQGLQIQSFTPRPAKATLLTSRTYYQDKSRLKSRHLNIQNLAILVTSTQLAGPISQKLYGINQRRANIISNQIAQLRVSLFKSAGFKLK